MKIRMNLDGDRFLARESILLKVELENTESSAVDAPSPEDLANPQFSYTITGPAYPQGSAFKSRVSRPDPNKPSLLKILPGQTMYVQLPLNTMFNLTQTGRYTLNAHYAWQGQSENFGPISFAIESGTLVSATVMADFGFQRSAMQRVLALVGNPPALYQFFFSEQRPQLGEIRLTSMMRAANAPADARRAVAPWTNFDRGDVSFARFGWQAPGTIGFESGLTGAAVKAALPGDAAFIAPALMPKDGVATVFVYTASNVTMLTFSLAAKGGPAPAASVQWTAAATSPIRGAAAALGPAPHNLACAVTVSQTATGAELKLFEAGGSGRARTAEVKRARVLPDSAPALWVDDRGEAHAAALFAEDNLLRRVFPAEVVWSAGGSARVDRGAAIQLPRASHSSAVTFAVTPARPPRSSWVILLDDGSVLSDLSGSEPYRTHRAPLLPLQLLGMASATYLLVADPVDFVGFEMLH